VGVVGVGGCGVGGGGVGVVYACVYVDVCVLCVRERE